MTRLSRSPLMEFSSQGSPPSVYHVRLTTRGLRWDQGSGKPVLTELHEFTLRLGAEYPRQAPDVTWRTPIFHPNIKREAVCHSGQWAPSWTLADFVNELNDMVRYQKHNVHSPLDSYAARWVSAHLNHLPVDHRGLRDTAVSIKVRPRKPG